MAFKKIKETIAAFKTPLPTHDDTMEWYRDSVVRRIEGHKADYDVALKIAFFIVIILPAAIAIGNISAKIFAFESASKYISTTVGIILAFIAGKFYEEITSLIEKWIPIHKLDPYFGSKIRETIRAFQKPVQPLNK